MNKPETLKKWVEVYRNTSTARGNKPRVALWRDGWVTKNRKEAEAAERTWYAPIRADRWFYYSSFPGRAWGGGVKGDPAVAVETWLQKARSIEDFKYDFLKPSLVVGTVDEVVDQIDRYRKDLKMEYLILRSRFGAGPTLERSLETMKLFAKEVMPHFRE